MNKVMKFLSNLKKEEVKKIYGSFVKNENGLKKLYIDNTYEERNIPENFKDVEFNSLIISYDNENKRFTLKENGPIVKLEDVKTMRKEDGKDLIFVGFIAYNYTPEEGTLSSIVAVFRDAKTRGVVQSINYMDEKREFFIDGLMIEQQNKFIVLNLDIFKPEEDDEDEGFYLHFEKRISKKFDFKK